MNAHAAALFITASVIVAAFAAMILIRKREEEKQFIKDVRNSWGKRSPRLFSVSETGGIRDFSDLKEGNAVDDITASDVDLDAVFRMIGNGAVSSPGAEILYSYLRHPVTDECELKRRIVLEDLFEEREELRHAVQRILFECGCLKQGSFCRCIREVRKAKRIGRGRFIALGAATAAAIVLLFFFPLFAVFLLILLLMADFRVHLKMKERTAMPLAGFQAVLRLLNASDALARIREEGIEEEVREIRELSSAFSTFRRGAFLVTSAGSVGTGADSALLDYIKLFFHVDLIRFDRMLAAMEEHEQDALRLLELIGRLDACCAAASYRASCPVNSRPVFLKEVQERPSVQITDLVHPLLDHPVPNTICTDQPVLLTGSNASGKSTFLKGVALSAILAQSIGVVTASSYEAPFFRIYSSMALRDNLSGGESYFVVESRSLLRIVNAAGTDGPPVLCLVDEVLRGTNTIERIAASSQILRELRMRGALCFAATHDIELSYLLEDEYRNMHFCETAAGHDLQFEYRLQDGRARSGNALRLLKEAGYPADVTDAAEKSARHFEETGEWKI